MWNAAHTHAKHLAEIEHQTNLVFCGKVVTGETVAPLRRNMEQPG